MASGLLASIPTINTFLSQLPPPAVDDQAGEGGITAEAFRSANQNQNVAQSSRALSGAQVSNEANDTAEITQIAKAENNKDLTISATTATGNTDTNLQGPRVSIVSLGSSRGGQESRIFGNFLQNQGGDQSSFADKTDAEGNVSKAGNTLNQSEKLDTTLNSENNLNVTAPTNLTNTDDRPVLTLVSVGADVPQSSPSEMSKNEENQTSQESNSPRLFPNSLALLFPTLPIFNSSSLFPRLLNPSAPTSSSNFLIGSPGISTPTQSTSITSPFSIELPPINLPILSLNPFDLFA